MTQKLFEVREVDLDAIDDSGWRGLELTERRFRALRDWTRSLTERGVIWLAVIGCYGFIGREMVRSSDRLTPLGLTGGITLALLALATGWVVTRRKASVPNAPTQEEQGNQPFQSRDEPRSARAP